MFSSMIQNLLSSSGQTSAMQRAVQMNNQIKTLSAQWAPVEKSAEAVVNNQNTQSFEKVLQAGAKAKFGELLTKPTTSVNAKLYTDTAFGVAKNVDYTNKANIKGLISRISKKHGVDEKLVNAVVKQESGYNPAAKSRVGALG